MIARESEALQKPSPLQQERVRQAQKEQPVAPAVRPRLLYAIFQLSLAQASRGVWFYAVLLVLSAMGAATAYSAASLSGLDDTNRFRAAIYSLMNLCFYFVSLLGLLVGALDMAGDQEGGMLHLLAAQPGERYKIILGKFWGQGMLLAVAAVFMMAVTGLVLVWKGLIFGAERLAAFSVLVVSLAAIFLCLGIAIGTMARSRLMALIAALATWLALAFLYDLIIFAFLGWGGAGELSTILAIALFLNPLDGFRILTLALLGNLTALGPSGAALMRMFPPPLGLLLPAISLVLWLGTPLATSIISLQRKDL